MLRLVVRLCAVSSAVAHFLKVENLEPRKEAFAHNFTVCISAMFEFSNLLQVGSRSLVSPVHNLEVDDVSREQLPMSACSWCRALKC